MAFVSLTGHVTVNAWCTTDAGNCEGKHWPDYIVLGQGGNQTTVQVTSGIGAFFAKRNILLERIPFWTSPEKLSACHHLSVTRVFRDLLNEITTTICQAWDLTPQFACGGGEEEEGERAGGSLPVVVSKLLKWWMTESLDFRHDEIPLRHCVREFWLVVEDLGDRKKHAQLRRR